jgi:hypothetical protein
MGPTYMSVQFGRPVVNGVPQLAEPVQCRESALDLINAGGTAQLTTNLLPVDHQLPGHHVECATAGSFRSVIAMLGFLAPSYDRTARNVVRFSGSSHPLAGCGLELVVRHRVFLLMAVSRRRATTKRSRW